MLHRPNINRRSKAVSPVAPPSAKIPAVIIGGSKIADGMLPARSNMRLSWTTRSSFGNSGRAAASIAESTYIMSGASLAGSANFALIANATKATAASFRILIWEPSGTGFTVAVICAFNEKAHASIDATEITVFIPILPADLPGIAPF
jgi:hypothetical protein